MQGSYADDVAVFPAFQGQRVATALFAAADEQLCASGRGRELTLDVRAANTPAIALYKALGFQFGENSYPGFLDWDGGFSSTVRAGALRSQLPQNATLEL
mmetsp:Transcript_32546/g.93723  ORF Transcript_32546/g.93723 Transcript_32546/m.93723 type:complete len:100 (+) Transcript_32546:565-864(+)